MSGGVPGTGRTGGTARRSFRRPRALGAAALVVTLALLAVFMRAANDDARDIASSRVDPARPSVDRVARLADAEQQQERRETPDVVAVEPPTADDTEPLPVVRRLAVRARIVDPQGLLREHLEPSIHLEVPRLAPGRGTWTFENSPSVDENGFLVAWFTYDEGDLRGRALDVELLVAPRSMYSWEWASPLLLEPAFHARARFTGVPEIDEPGLAVVDLGEVAPRALPVAATFEIRSDRDEVCEVGFSRFTEMVVNGVSMPDRVEIRTNETHELFGWLDSPTERWHLWGSARDEPGRVVFAPWFGPGDHVVATLAEPISLTVDSTGIFDIDDGWAVLTPRAEHVPAVPLPEGSRPSSRLFAILQRENWSRPSLNTYGFQVSRRDPVRFEGLPPGDYVLDLWLEAQAVVGPLLSVDVTLPLPGGGEVLEL